MEIKTLREQIDEIDRQIVDLYCRRMDTAREIGRFKAENHLPVRDPEREAFLLDKAAARAGDLYGPGIRELYQLLLRHSRELQQSEK